MSFVQEVSQSYYRWFEVLANLDDATNDEKIDVVSTIVAASDDLSDSIVESIIQYHPSVSIDKTPAKTWVARGNATVAAVLETPDITNSYVDGEDVSSEIAGAMGAATNQMGHEERFNISCGRKT